MHLNAPLATNFLYQFDDISTVNGLAIVPSPYHHLYFSSYNVLRPRDPSLDGKITERDLNCAVSSPNALIGSRCTSDSTKSTKGAYFGIANASAMASDGLHPYFTLISFNIKPMDAPPAVISVHVKGYSQIRDCPFHWHVDFPAGFHEPFLVKMEEYSGEEWKLVYGIEIIADYGEDALDWEFCIDDLEVQFSRYREEILGRGRTNQAVFRKET